MAITTRAGVRSGLQWSRPFVRVGGSPQSGKWGTFWASTGNPGAGSYSASLSGATCSSSTTGALPFTDPASGNSYLGPIDAALFASNYTGGQLLLCDRLWHNGGFTITSTSAQTVTSATFPARDSNASTNGRDVMLALEVSATCGAASPTVTVSYTNDAGTSGRTATNWLATSSSPAATTVYPIGLQAGDRGVRSVESLTLSASWVSGTINLVAYRLLGVFNLPPAPRLTAVNDEIQSGFQRIIDGSCLYWMFTGATGNATTISGSVAWAQG